MKPLCITLYNNRGCHKGTHYSPYYPNTTVPINMALAFIDNALCWSLWKGVFFCCTVVKCLCFCLVSLVE